MSPARPAAPWRCGKWGPRWHSCSRSCRLASSDHLEKKTIHKASSSGLQGWMFQWCFLVLTDVCNFLSRQCVSAVSLFPQLSAPGTSTKESAKRMNSALALRSSGVAIATKVMSCSEPNLRGRWAKINKLAMCETNRKQYRNISLESAEHLWKIRYGECWSNSIILETMMTRTKICEHLQNCQHGQVTGHYAFICCTVHCHEHHGPSKLSEAKGLGEGPTSHWQNGLRPGLGERDMELRWNPRKSQYKTIWLPSLEDTSILLYRTRWKLNEIDRRYGSLWLC